MRDPQPKSLDQMRAALLMSQAKYEKSVNDMDRHLSRTLWGAAASAAEQAFRYQQNADTVRASRSTNDAIAEAEARVWEIGADVFVAASRELARTVETIPSFADPRLLAQLNLAWTMLARHDEDGRGE